MGLEEMFSFVNSCLGLLKRVKAVRTRKTVKRLHESFICTVFCKLDYFAEQFSSEARPNISSKAKSNLTSYNSLKKKRGQKFRAKFLYLAIINTITRLSADV